MISERQPRISDMSENIHDDDLPADLARPARRALVQAGYTRLDHLFEISDATLLRLHGMGPKALERIRASLREGDG